jgi:hypothetical protein
MFRHDGRKMDPWIDRGIFDGSGNLFEIQGVEGT